VNAVRWHDENAPVSWGELSLEGTGEAKHTGVILARIDPARVSLRLDAVASEGLAPIGAEWSLPSAPPDALLAVNAGQFNVGGAWGWVVRGGREYQIPRSAPLAPAIVVDAGGRVSNVAPGSIDSAARTGRVAEAFQSYPMLLIRGEVPAPLQRTDGGIDVAHRDARLALGVLGDGRVLIALTRFEGLGGRLQLLPLGLTTPEMAALMGALGCRDAVLLDGGVSGQLSVRDAAGWVHRWAGLRRVPLGLVALPAAGADRPR
jgi:exopolysaccharide biosynthesis protein